MVIAVTSTPTSTTLSVESVPRKSWAFSSTWVLRDKVAVFGRRRNRPGANVTHRRAPAVQPPRALEKAVPTLPPPGEGRYVEGGLELALELKALYLPTVLQAAKAALEEALSAGDRGAGLTALALQAVRRGASLPRPSTAAPTAPALRAASISDLLEATIYTSTEVKAAALRLTCAGVMASRSHKTEMATAREAADAELEASLQREATSGTARQDAEVELAATRARDAKLAATMEEAAARIEAFGAREAASEAARQAAAAELETMLAHNAELATALRAAATEMEASRARESAALLFATREAEAWRAREASLKAALEAARNDVARLQARASSMLDYAPPASTGRSSTPFRYSQPSAEGLVMKPVDLFTKSGLPDRRRYRGSKEAFQRNGEWYFWG